MTHLRRLVQCDPAPAIQPASITIRNGKRPPGRTLENWMDQIVNYFVARSSNGRTEGFNRGLRAILWRACGMHNFSHFRLRVLHAFG
jgi:hypothetical protein